MRSLFPLRIVCCLLLITLCLHSTRAENTESTGRPFLSAPRTALPPTIDGKLDDACWKVAAHAGYFFVLNSRRLALKQTAAFLCWDTENIYVAFACDEPEPDKIRATVETRDAADLWQDDSVEVFLTAGELGDAVHHVIVNAAGQVYDESSDGDPASWDAEVKAGVAKGAKQWTVEFSIPLIDLQSELNEDTVWKANFNRHSTQPDECSCWSPCDQKFFRPEQFGHVRFTSNAASVWLESLGDTLGDLGKDGASASLMVANPTGKGMTLKVIPQTHADQLMWKPAEPQSVTIIPNSRKAIRALYKTPDRTGNLLTVQALDGNTVVFDSGSVPLRDRFLRPRLDDAVKQHLAAIKTLDGLQTALPEVPALRNQLATSLKTVYRLTQSLAAPAPSTPARWLEVDRKLRASEDAVREAQVTLAILTGYTADELKSPKMVRQYVLFTRSPFATATPDTRPEKSEIQRTVSLFATPGEFESVTFLLCSRAPLENVTVKASDLTGLGGVIPASSIDLRVVKYWWQAGRSPEKDPKMVMVPELLLKDDRVMLKGSEPEIPAKSDPITDCPSGGTKQFWITVGVPANANAGNYQSTLTVLAPGQPVSKLTLQLRVLPFVLPEPAQFLVMEYRNRLEEKHGAASVSQDRYQADLKNIRDHGFQSAAIFDTAAVRDRALAIQQKVGMVGAIPIVDEFSETTDVRQVLDQRRRWKYPPLLFYLPEPVKTTTELDAARKKLLVVRAGGGTTIAVTTPQGAAQLRGILDVPCYSVTHPDTITYLRNRLTGNVSPVSATECYSWEAMQEDPAINRLFCGYYLWKSGLSGILPQTYQGIVAGDDPYSDGAGATLRQRMVTYPSHAGPINTIQWEAAREGIDDLRYLTLLRQLIVGVRNIRRPGLPQAIEGAEKTMNRITSSIQIDHRITLKNLKPQDYQTYRWQVAEAVLNIMDAMGNRIPTPIISQPSTVKKPAATVFPKGPANLPRTSRVGVPTTTSPFVRKPASGTRR